MKTETGVGLSSHLSFDVTKPESGTAERNESGEFVGPLDPYSPPAYRCPTPEASFSNTQAFFENFFMRGSNLFLTFRSHFEAETWPGKLRYTIEYLRTEKSLREIGRDYGKSGEMVRKHIEAVVNKLHESDPLLQQCYPRHLLSLSKPPTETSRRQTSERMTKTAHDIVDIIQQGGSYLDLLSAGFTAKQIADARRSAYAGTQNVQVPYAPNRVSDSITRRE